MGAHLEPQLKAWLAAHPEARGQSFADWVRNSQAAQAEALKAAIEWLAANRPRCMGALVWQFNDAWPGMSWSLVDSEGRPKLAYEAVKEAFGKIAP
jgi:beta-mannosidase